MFGFGRPKPTSQERSLVAFSEMSALFFQLLHRSVEEKLRITLTRPIGTTDIDWVSGKIIDAEREADVLTLRIESEGKRVKWNIHLTSVGEFSCSPTETTFTFERGMVAFNVHPYVPKDVEMYQPPPPLFPQN